MVMSFLVVTRVVQSYNRYMADSSTLQEMYRSVRELVVYSCDIADARASEWRFELSVQMMKLLSICMKILHFRSRIYEDRLHTLPNDLRVDSLKETQGLSSMEPPPLKGPTVLLAEACRAASHQAFVVRQVIRSYRDTDFEPLFDEMLFLNTVGNFLKQFDTLEQHMTTVRPIGIRVAVG